MLYLLMMLMFFISISMSTLFERKLIAFMNLRWGPNKNIYMGIMIPFSDFLKLINKKYMKNFFFNFYYYFVYWGLFFFILMIFTYPLNMSMNSMEYGFLMFFIYYSLMIYMFFFVGWSSNSKYSIIASYRVLIQSVSYEVGFVFSFLIINYLWLNLDFFYMFKLNFMFLINFTFTIMFLMFLLGESGRSPFDTIEGESELVSGFNIEYYASMFSFIFMIEYGLLIYMSIIFTYLMIGNMSILMYLIVFMFFCLSRCMFPRFRYDKMMIFFWKDLLFMIIYFYFYMFMFFN